jgi:hypothetical protein
MTTERPANSGADRRIVRRRNLKHSVAITVRKGTMGLGPDVAAGGIELSADGVQLEVKIEFKKGDEVEIGLTGVGRSRPMTLVAEVRWCQPIPDGGTFLIGASFRRRLTHHEMAEFV